MLYLCIPFSGFWGPFNIGGFSITNPWGCVTFSATLRGEPFQTQKVGAEQQCGVIPPSSLRARKGQDPAPSGTIRLRFVENPSNFGKKTKTPSESAKSDFDVPKNRRAPPGPLRGPDGGGPPGPSGAPSFPHIIPRTCPLAFAPFWSDPSM